MAVFTPEKLTAVSNLLLFFKNYTCDGLYQLTRAHGEASAAPAARTRSTAPAIP